ncbi:hypothetical protein [Leeuwenhoekiella parthenopeia]|uniref:Secreted protein n=1 Tax=Leeuwenhoekiella parthenopeia TaxID=2890320 RepID=A0ABS8GQP7_9FLAO|nr:hypothetical protein [Leeuwenhoekiella parthenopeia]MCC4212309.1 hypothetical protein [Leeuwenhoekiella parthenopeia]
MNRYAFPKRGLLLVTMILVGFSAFSQIDNRSGSFKIPAAKDTTNTPAIQPEKSTPDLEVPRSQGALKLDASGKLVERPVLRAPESSDFYMLDREDFADSGKRYTDAMNEYQARLDRERRGNVPRENIDFGVFKGNSKQLIIKCRDFGAIDNDRVAILNNNRTVVPGIFLAGTFTQITMQLEEGFNKIAIKALNQGSLGANTAEFYIYDELGNLVYSNQWLLATGFEAQFVYVKESSN